MADLYEQSVEKAEDNKAFFYTDEEGRTRFAGGPGGGGGSGGAGSGGSDDLSLQPRTITAENGRLVIEVRKPYLVGDRAIQTFYVNGRVVMSAEELKKLYPVAYKLVFGV